MASASSAVTRGEPRSAPRLKTKHILFAVIALMYAYVLWTDESFLFNAKDPEWHHIESFKWWLLPHGVAAACALFLGPLQFSDRLRQRLSKMHHVLGYIYIAGAIVGAPLGIFIQYFEEHMGGTRSFTVATVLDAGVWIFTTLMALAFIRQGKVTQHKQWMTRSFACALIFIEVRVIIGLTGWEKYAEAIVWGGVAAAVPLADFVLHWQDLRRPKPVPVRARSASAAI